MRAQRLGIGISLAVHGMAAMVLFGISQTLMPAVKTIRIDFSLDSGSRWGNDGSGGSNEGYAPLAVGPEPRPVLSEKRPHEILKSHPIKDQIPSEGEKASPAGSVPQEHATMAVSKPPALNRVQSKPVRPKKAVKPNLKKKVKPETPVQAVKPVPSPYQKNDRRTQISASSEKISDAISDSKKIESMADADGLAEFKSVHVDGLPEGLHEERGYGRPGASIQDEKYTGIPQGSEGTSYLSAHFNFIRGRLKECLYYPSIARKRGWSGKVMVAFTIYPDGRAENIEIQESCGNSLLDKSALKTVRNACPFPKPPITARIVIPILYQLN